MSRLLFITWITIAAGSPGICAAEIIVSNAWVRMPVGQAMVTAGYVTLQNTGPETDSFIGVRAQGVAKTEMHRTTSSENGVMRMRLVERIDLPAGETVAFKSGGDHLMLMGIEKPIASDDLIQLTLMFEHAGEVTTSAIVARRNPFP